MSYELGAVKWSIGMLLTPVGFVSLYIFGDGIWNTITHLQALFYLFQHLDQPAVVLSGLIEIYIPTPDSLLSSFVRFPLVGAVVGGIFWYLGSTA